MGERPDYHGFQSCVNRAVKNSLAEIRTAHHREQLVGYALCTDDDLRTLYHVACTKEFLDRVSDPQILYVPVDWEYDDGASFFEEPRTLLRSLAETAQHPGKHIDAAFDSLVSALRDLRAAGLFGDEVILLVTSTDPGPRLSKLGELAASDLNSAEKYREWRNAIEG